MQGALRQGDRAVRILFVCHGNICRSPMAEFVMKDIVRKHADEACFDIASAATSSEEIGNPVHPGTAEVLAEAGIPCTGKRARKLKSADYAAYDLLIGMDEANVRNMVRLFGADPEAKIKKLLEFAGETGDIADPWYTGDFSATYDDVLAGCQGLYRFLRP